MIQPIERPNPPLAVRIVPMEMAHIAEVYAIEVSAYPRPWPLKCFLDELQRNPFSYYVVALDQGKVIGYAGLWLVRDEGHITNVAVSYGSRRRKVAEQLLLHTIEVSLKRGLSTIFLEVRRFNTAAQHLYVRYGFRPVRVRERYYQDNDEDAIELRVENIRSREFMEQFLERRNALNRALKQARHLHTISGSET